MPAPPVLHDLVQRFREQLADYKSGRYNETQLRREFIDPFFKALGWDVDNEHGYAEAYKDVVHEAAVRLKEGEEAGRLKAPDYSFRVGGQRKFFVEAKKPSVNIKGAPAPAFQVRRYGWSADLPLSILTDFEEFAVYDCRYKPEKGDSPATARIFYYTFDQYAAKWDEIAGYFGKEAILKGAFDRFAADTKKKRGTQEPGDAFLQEIEGWREKLARDIARRNPALRVRDLNAAVQQTIDRLLFLRIAEDRGIEPYGELRELAKGQRVYPRLVEAFREADARYNSGLFHFTAEKGRAGTPDTLTPGLDVGDLVLKEIVKHLYYPDSPYAFDVLPVDILGQVYERFLGKKIVLDGKQARVEEKPEVRKAGGVYYTPTYVVRYIVARTLDPLLEGKTPDQIKTLAVLDPACGSGSFLLGAYDHLLAWYLSAYAAQPEKWARGPSPRLVQAQDGGWRLALDEKKRILMAHLYGVDIDEQAVEVTKLSLLLKVLEGESAATLQLEARYGRKADRRAAIGGLLFRERLLPDLSGNIRCGNSLIGSDFYAGVQIEAFSEDDLYRINAFDWPQEFPAVMQRGGFDAVIGNPPYIRIQTMTEWASPEVAYIKRRYEAAAKGNFDIYVAFVEKGMALLHARGRLGYILPHKFFNAQYGAGLRRLVAERRALDAIVHFGHQQIFEGATTYTCLLFLDQRGQEAFHYAEVNDLAAWQIEGAVAAEGTLAADTATEAEWNFAAGPGATLFYRLASENPLLGDVADVYVGLQTSADDVYIMDCEAQKGNRLLLRSQALKEVRELETDLFFPIVSGTDVQRYAPLPDRQYILFPYEVNEGSATLIPLAQIAANQPRTAMYLMENKERLEGREKGKMKGDGWHGYVYRKNLTRQEVVKLCVPRLVSPLHATFDAEGRHFLDNVDVNGVVWKQPFAMYDLRYLLALLNSRLLQWYFPFVSAPFRGGYMSANKQFLSQLPIHLPGPDEQAQHDRLVALVDLMLDLNRQARTASGHTRTLLDRRLAATDAEINRLVYALYRLTDAEIALVEGGAAQ